MSSILKALKKLEKEHPQQDEVITWPQKIDTKRAVSKKTKRTLFFKKTVGVFSVAVILGVGLWLFLSQKPFWVEKHSAVTAFFGQKAEEERTASVQVRKKVTKKSVPRREIIVKNAPRPSIGKTAHPALQEKDTGPGKKREKPHLDKKEVDRKMPLRIQKASENTLKPVSREEAEIDEQTIVAATKKSGPGLERRKTPTLKKVKKPISGKIAEDKKFASAEIMDDSRLELQAIAWSVDVERRIAVINGRVVREGAIIEGFTVTRIGKDEVFVTEGNELRKLVFITK